MLRALALSALLWPLACAGADKVCSPSRLLKVVTTIETPGMPKDHFLRVPTTLYRLGDGNGRIEEAPNPRTGNHLLIVINEPDVWAVNLALRKGKYQKDPGPTYYFRARLFDNSEARSAVIRTLEIGCEVKWLLEAGAKPLETVHPTLGAVNQLEFVEGNERLVLYERGGKPLQLEFYGPQGWLKTT